MLTNLKILISRIKESTMKTSERSRPQLKPKFPRIKRLLDKRSASQWYATADAEGNVQLHPQTHSR